MRICSVEGCDRKHMAKGLCATHYGRMLRGLPEDGSMRSRSPIERLMDRLTIDADTDCWIPDYPIREDGYRCMTVEGKKIPCHRFSYQHHYGHIPTGLVVDHLCRNRSCVNPDHLEAVTQYENIVVRGEGASAVNARRTHCVHGHPFDAQNTVLRKDGKRACLACRKVSSPDGSGVEPPSTPEGSEVGEEGPVVDSGTGHEGEPGGPGQPAGPPSAAAREALKKVAKP